jgi:hypothetical protein
MKVSENANVFFVLSRLLHSSNLCYMASVKIENKSSFFLQISLHKDRSQMFSFAFSDTFIHFDMMAYLGFYIPVRSRNWELRNASLKKLGCLFHAFDKQNYLRMMPYHKTDHRCSPPQWSSLM